MVKNMTEDECPVKLTTEIIGGKWKSLILYYLKGGPQRTSQLQKMMLGVSKKMLTQHLRELEQDDIVHRRIYAQVPPKVEYSLSKHGESLKPILELMAAWGTKHRSKYRTK